MRAAAWLSPGPALVQAQALAVAQVPAAAKLSPEPAQALAEAPLVGPAQAQAEAPLAGPAQAPAAVLPLPVLAPVLRAVALLPVPELELTSALRPVPVEARRSPSRLASWQVSALPSERPAPRLRLTLHPQLQSNPEAPCRLPATVEAQPGIPSVLRSRTAVGRRMAAMTNRLRWPGASETSMRTLLGGQ